MQNSRKDKLLIAEEELDRIVARQVHKNVAVQQFAEVVQRLVGSGICMIVMINANGSEVENIACAGSAIGFCSVMLDWWRTAPGQPGNWLAKDEKLLAGQGIILHDLQADGRGIISAQTAEAHGLQSMYVYSHCTEDSHHLYLIHFFQAPPPPESDELKRLEQMAYLVRISVERIKANANRRRLQRLNEVMQKMAEVRDVKKLVEMLLTTGAEMVEAPHATISRLDFNTGDLVVADHIGSDPRQNRLSSGSGLTSKCLREGVPILAHDVRQPPWADQYQVFWEDTRAELCVPIILRNTVVRVGTSVVRDDKPIGVLNMECNRPYYFSSNDADTLRSLAEYGGLLIERLETDIKQAQVVEMLQQILNKPDWEGTIEIMLKAIKDMLGYEYVNISMVNYETKTIQTQYLVGMPEEEKAEFMRLANHRLDDKDIQADICRTRQIEVPPFDDPRVDRTIRDRFNHDQMVRVFLPMIAPSDNRVIGTVEAGYRRSDHRGKIYEQDVQILKGFIDSAAVALDRREKSVLEKIGHELRAPVIGIRNSSSMLRRRHAEYDSQKIERLCDDMLIDCAILLSQIAQLEHYLGKALPESKIEPTLLYRDVVIKTINQFSLYAREQGLDDRKISYNPDDMQGIPPLWVDKVKLGEVFNNLVINSIKYATSDPSVFAIHIVVDDTRDDWLVRVRDWGIGVKEGYEEKIFNEGFRTPEARNRNPTGSGLGLTIARKYMRHMEGDLYLSHSKDPTEFTVKFPKHLARQKKKEARYDPVRR